MQDIYKEHLKQERGHQVLSDACAGVNFVDLIGTGVVLDLPVRVVRCFPTSPPRAPTWQCTGLLVGVFLVVVRLLASHACRTAPALLTLLSVFLLGRTSVVVLEVWRVLWFIESSTCVPTIFVYWNRNIQVVESSRRFVISKPCSVRWHCRYATHVVFRRFEVGVCSFVASRYFCVDDAVCGPSRALYRFDYVFLKFETKEKIMNILAAVIRLLTENTFGNKTAHGALRYAVHRL